jgi:hypothetical protein
VRTLVVAALIIGALIVAVLSIQPGLTAPIDRLTDARSA